MLLFAVALAGLLPGGRAAEAGQDEPGAKTADGTPAWPIYRGDPGLRGIAEGGLGDELELAWSFETEAAIESSPVIGHGKAYIGSKDGYVYAIDLDTGERAWRFETEHMVEAPPTLHGGSVYIGSVDGFLYRLDGETGELKWKYETGNKITGAANLVRSPDSERMLVIFGSHDARLHCVDAETGEKVWRYETDNFINGTPAIDEGRAIFGGCDGFLHVVSITDGEAMERVEIGSYVAGSVAQVGSSAYLGHYGNAVIAADLEAGEIAWTYEDRNFPYFASPAVSEDRVLVGGHDKRLHCLRRESGEAVWTFATRGQINSSPVIVGDRAVVGSDDGRLYLVRMEDGEEAWSYEIGEAVTSSPAVGAGYVIVGAQDGNVYAFRTGKQRSE